MDKAQNETVEQVCEKMKEPSIYKGRFPASFFDGEFREFADRILAAHKRELDELIDASVHTNDLLTKQIEAKNAEIERLEEKVAMRDCSCEDADSERMEAEIASLKKSVERWMQYHETAKGERDACLDELKKKDAEIARLRALVDGLIEASTLDCACCNYACGPNRENCIVHEAAKYIEESEEVEK